MKLDNLFFALFIFLPVLLYSCDNNQSSSQFAATETNSDTGEMIDTMTINNKETERLKRDVVTNNDWLLQPGSSAGQTFIDENADNIYQRLGTPDGGDAAMQKAVAIWFSHHDTTAYSVSVYTARNTDSPAIARVLQIRITSPSFKTKEGIHTTSSLADIQKAFPVVQTEDYTDAGTNYTVYDSKQGIAFEINSHHTCVAIIIHKAGTTGERTYLKFRTTNRFINR